jgi:hypothetical protein
VTAADHVVSMLSMAADAQVFTMRKIQALLCSAQSVTLAAASGSECTSGIIAADSLESGCNSQCSDSASSEEATAAQKLFQEEVENHQPNVKPLPGSTVNCATRAMKRDQQANLRGGRCRARIYDNEDVESDMGSCLSEELDGRKAVAAEVLRLQQQMLRIADAAARLAAACVALSDASDGHSTSPPYGAT